MQINYPIQDNNTYIDLLVNQVLTGRISFPLAKTFLDSPEIMFTNLKNFKPRYYHQKYHLDNYYSKYKLYLPPLFRGNPLIIQSLADDYFQIDGLTDHFTESVRIDSKKYYNNSVSECWNNKQFLYKLMSIVVKYPIITNKILRNTIYHLINEPSLFKLSWAKGLIEIILGSKLYYQRCHILDMSAGWGDRLLAAICCNCDYLGFDPNEQLKSGHQAIINSFGNPQSHQVIYQPFENAILPDDHFDLILTSPPFFHLEIYSNDINQSSVKFKSFNEWLTGFLFESLRKSWSALKDGGYLAIYMADYSHYKICEPMNLFIEQVLPGSSWEGIIGLSGSKEKTSPVWVWQKLTSRQGNIWNSSYSNRPFRKLYSTLIDPDS